MKRFLLLLIACCQTYAQIGSAAHLDTTPVVSTPGSDQLIPTEKAVRTALSTAGGNGGWSSGTFANMPATCTPGVGTYLYFAVDQPALQQIYTCDSTNHYVQYLNIDGSGLEISGGTLGIDSGKIPGLSTANIFTAIQVLPSGSTITPRTTDPGCSNVGKVWVDTTDITTTHFKICGSVASVLAWITVF